MILHHIRSKAHLCFFGCILFLLVFQACKGKKNRHTAFERADTEVDGEDYSFRQNFTSKYNILYHANLMLDNERDAIFKSANKNYQIRQTVFDEPSGEGDAHQLMDSLIQKAYKIVNRKQESKYVNEAYFIIGKANYLKGAYHTSIEFFNHLLKAAESQKEYLPLAYAWKSRALLQIGKMSEAQIMVDSAFVTLDDSKPTRTFVNAAKANYLIRMGEELEAIPYLQYALESNKSTLDKYRWLFLLAQLYKDNGQVDKASAYFSKISVSNVPFDMAFEAALQKSLLDGAKYVTTDDRVKPLIRMLREGKNDGYQDQILYQIGEVFLVQGEDKEAIQYFKKSLAEPKRNNYQATETYLRLADYYFDQKQYATAQLFYDSVAITLPADYTDVNKLRRKLGYMEEITSLYTDVARKDTLLQLSALNEQDLESTLNRYADEQLKIKKEQIALLRKEAKGKKKGNKQTSGHVNQSLSAFNALNQDNSASVSNGDRTFYFNNPDEKLLGQTAFKRRWGNRQLKDDWRYDVGQILAPVGGTVQAQVADSPVKQEDELDEETFIAAIRTGYMEHLPKTQGAVDSLNNSIHDNLIVIGNIYRDYTKSGPDAIKAYEAYLTRYPNTPAGADIYYSLYRMYMDLDRTKSNHYRDRLIALYPNTLHAKVAADPSYMDKYRRDKNILDRLFERLFGLYASGDHAEVIREADRELQGRFENTTLVAQVEYLRALAVGRVGRVEDFTAALSTIVEKYPMDSLVTPLANENIAFIAENPNVFINRVNALQDVNKSRETFVDEPHMTPWPLLNIQGDYRTGIALAPKPKVEPKEVQKTQQVATQKKDIPVAVAKVEEKKPELKNTVDTVKKEEIAVNVEKPIEKAIEQKMDTIAVAKVEEKKEALEDKKSIAVLEELGAMSQVSVNQKIAVDAQLVANPVQIGGIKIDLGPNDYRDKKLFPDTADYYYVVNVLDAKVNMAPSRYGIGQFNRTRYQNNAINHQLKVVNNENQLIFVGPFKSFEEVKAYEARILSMMPEIMKVPTDIYNTFVITKEVIPSLTDGVTIRNYHQNYIEQ